jgi:hypothetical protein
MPLAVILLVVAVAGLAVAAVSVITLRVIGARPALARRLAGPPELKVGRLLDAGGRAPSLVRVAGRIRCREPLHAGGGERLVAYHRDVEVKVAGRWRTVERLRETRSFELWDHEGSLTIDPAHAAEPLVSIPRVWNGDPGELEEPHASAVARLAEEYGPAAAARATTRTLNVTDDLLVLARPVASDDGQVRLVPPPGGFVITNLALPDAMRLLGGRHHRTAAVAVIGAGIGLALAAIGTLGAVVAAIIGI